MHLNATRLFNKSLSTLRELVSETWVVSFTLFKLMVPILLIVKGLEIVGAFPYINQMFKPLMALVGLPETMGLVWTTTMLTNIYGGMIVFFQLAAEENLSVAQVTVLASMMLIAHALPVEVRIVQKAGVRLPVAILIRLLSAMVFGMILNGLYSAGAYLQEPAVLAWTPEVGDPRLSIWLWEQIKSLAMIVVIIGVLLSFLRLLRALGIERLMIRCLQPLLRLLGIGPEATSLTIIGLTLGLSFGGALLIKESRAGHISPRDIFTSLLLLGLCHSMIEDTLLALLMGAHISGVLWMRLIFGFALVALVTRLPQMNNPKFRARYLVSPKRFSPGSESP